VQTLVEIFSALRHERATRGTPNALTLRCSTNSSRGRISKFEDWKSVELRHLMSFLQHERERALGHQPKGFTRRLSSESVYLEIALARLLSPLPKTKTAAHQYSPKTCPLPPPLERLPKALTGQKSKNCSPPEKPRRGKTYAIRPCSNLLCLGLRLAELRGLRLEQLTWRLGSSIYR